MKESGIKRVTFKDTDVNEKKLYAKYRAAEILNAVKNGVAPSPPTGEVAASISLSIVFQMINHADEVPITPLPPTCSDK